MPIPSSQFREAPFARLPRHSCLETICDATTGRLSKSVSRRVQCLTRRPSQPNVSISRVRNLHLRGPPLIDSLPDGMTLRDATREDLPQIVEIYNASIPGRLATADTEPINVDDRSEWFQRHDPARRPLWVLKQEDRIVAWVDLRDFYGRPAYHATAEIAVYIADDFQGRGLGTLLKRELMDACPRLGVTTLLSFVFGQNAASIRVNEKLGFEQWGRYPEIAELDGQACDLLVFGWKCTADAQA
uniref:Phosphinothricin N-acetyltransferase n=1 Tax=uncultured planctomycete 3FN TaxID=455066 RepID=A9LGW1_9BACT|nr:phosphinothricin N-acetyltransferase [uncultured planctomycete 3FN]